MIWVIFLILFLVVLGFLVFNALALLFLSTGGFLRTIFGGGRKRKDANTPPPQKKYKHDAEEVEYEIIE